jgi:hypothetical protein
MGSKATPAPPDYRGAAEEQSAASRENVMLQNYANRPVINTPFGSQSWQTASQTDPATGLPVTQWTQNVNLDPGLESALESQIGTQLARSNLAQGFTGRVAEAYEQPFDWQNLPGMTLPGEAGQLQTEVADYSPGLATAYNFGGLPEIPTYDTNYRNEVAETLMEQMLPVQDYQRQQLETQLANQGFRVGTEGYKRALDELGERQSRERYQALNTAGSEAQRLYGMQMGSRTQGVQEAMAQGNLQNRALGQASGLDLSSMQARNAAVAQQQALNQQYGSAMNTARQQAIAEQAQQRGMSLNELNALLSGQQVNMPSFPSFTAAGRAETPQYLDAAGMQYNAALDAFNAKQAGLGGLMSGAFSLGSAALGNPFAFSDIRLKSNIQRVGTHPIGVGIYEYDIFGHRERGVIAQELQRIKPSLVRQHDSGYLTVNYGAL